jgi:hypothetical protein
LALSALGEGADGKKNIVEIYQSTSLSSSLFLHLSGYLMHLPRHKTPHLSEQYTFDFQSMVNGRGAFLLTSPSNARFEELLMHFSSPLRAMDVSELASNGGFDGAVRGIKIHIGGPTEQAEAIDGAGSWEDVIKLFPSKFQLLGNVIISE